MYDCTNDVLEHRKQVRRFLQQVVGELIKRQVHHDDSKLREPEKSMYDEFTPLLRGLTYGSPEYEDCRKQMGVALQHHYKVNSHHPEHYPNGLSGMSLLDLIEMLADWRAAIMRHEDGRMANSLEINADRFDMSDQLYLILKNTINELDWWYEPKK